MRVLIFGGRDFKDYNLLECTCNSILTGIKDEITIISGHAKGADTLGEVYARKNNFKLEIFKADWNNLDVIPCRKKYKYGKPYNALAGLIRNEKMVNITDLAICFWNSKSPGTKDTINLCKKKGIQLKEIYY